MPSTSKKQHNFMAAIAHSPEFAKKAGVPVKVGKEFMKADKGRKFREGGTMKESKAMVKKEIGFMKKAGAPASMIKHEESEAKGMKSGGVASMQKIAAKAVKGHEERMHKMAKGGVTRADGIVKKGHTKGKTISMCGGGYMKKGK